MATKERPDVLKLIDTMPIALYNDMRDIAKRAVRSMVVNMKFSPDDVVAVFDYLVNMYDANPEFLK